MTKTSIDPFVDTSTRLGGDRLTLLPDLSRPAMNIDLSRPPTPGSFRFSLEEMRRGTEEMVGRGFPPVPRRPQADPCREAGRDPWRVDGERDAVREPAGRRSHASRDAERSHRPAVTRETKRPSEPRRERTAGDAPGSVESREAAAQEGPPSPTAVEAGDAGGTRSDAAAVVVAAEEAAAKAAAGSEPAPAQGDRPSSSGQSGAETMPAPPKASGQAATPGENEASPAPTDPATAEDKKAHAPMDRAATAAAVQTKAAAKAAAPLAPGTAAEANGAAAKVPETVAGVPVKGGGAGHAAVQMAPPVQPAAVTQQTTVSAGQAPGAAAPAEESSIGRVIRIGADNQSGQTALFQADHGAGPPVQGSAGSKAAEAPPPPFQHDLLRQVSEKVVFHLKNGRSEAHIELKPENLGHLKLHVSTDKGQVVLKIMTESAWVRDVIESSISQLKNDLQQHNLQIDRLEVSVSGGQRDAAGGQPQGDGAQRPSAGTAGDGNGTMAAAEEETLRRPAHPGMRVGMVDYFA